MPRPYPRFPTVHGDTVVFGADDDLWRVPLAGGRAERLTVGRATGPSAFSPDGTRLAFVSTARGTAEIHLHHPGTGETTQLTWQGAPAVTWLGWTPDGTAVRYTLPAAVGLAMWEVPAEGGAPRPAGTGGTAAGERFVWHGWYDPAYWKRYRGGATGKTWWDPHGTGDPARVLTGLPGNVGAPVEAFGRLFFVADHEGTGNVYSLGADGGLRRHTDHDDFYARGLSTDGSRLVYHAGGELYAIETPDADGHPRRIDVEIALGPRPPRLVDAAAHARDATLSPDGTRVAVTVRGGLYDLPVAPGPVRRLGDPATRHHTVRHLGDTIAALACDAGPEERLTTLATESWTAVEADLGSIVEYAVSPDGRRAIVADQRYRLHLVGLEDGSVRELDRSPHGALLDAVWHPGGSWIAYRYPEEGTEPEGEARASVRLRNVDTGEWSAAAERLVHDSRPSFDPDGHYLYFVSVRDFAPVYDALHLDMAFLKGSRPYAVELRPGLGSPFEPGEREGTGVELDGITGRVHRFPVPDGRYKRVLGLPGGRALLLSGVAHDQLDRRRPAGTVADTLERLDFATAALTKIADRVADVEVSRDGSTMLYRSGDRRRVLPSGASGEGEAGYLDLGRITARVRDADEWPQMFREAWRAQREHFWTADMSGIDWDGVWERYAPLLERLRSRRELHDLIMEMHGELATSHGYAEFAPPLDGLREAPAHLGVDWAADWSVERVLPGDPWNPERGSPLRAAGIVPGDKITMVNGRPVSTGGPPELLVGQAGKPVELTIAGRGPVTVVPLADETGLRYREWVEANRRRVHEETGGRVGYVHLPNMMPEGYATFMRHYLSEYWREALIVDARFNGGGHLSPLVLEKLARRRIGQVQFREGRTQPYPLESPRGPLVALVNEFCGSDGDIFAQAFRLFGLGTLIGTRTWGGVVGSTHRQVLADGSATTQPAMALSFDTVGWGVEGHGVDPDLEVVLTPADRAAGRDPQLAAGIERALADLAERPAYEHDVRPKPVRRQPPLPPRAVG
ncbi:tricorn protease [Actinorhabdospora filicis]|uniref:Tricorn protease homolog n=1 Tax=Actinorhabdospora filicis TaxID=1785913 RepID=A0A9W6W7R1_9ACTN|nr:S41 family peptidase [Actinorhabdospora filicis]GLZ76193.1 tricorn protease [Actinorhabdospora filicis]